LILERVGARRWIARIMISWGVIAASFAFVSPKELPRLDGDLVWSPERLRPDTAPWIAS
jgi:hypothetical protein